MEAGVGVGLDSYVTGMSDLVFQGVFRGTEYHDNITFVTKTFCHASHLSWKRNKSGSHPLSIHLFICLWLEPKRSQQISASESEEEMIFNWEGGDEEELDLHVHRLVGQVGEEPDLHVESVGEDFDPFLASAPQRKTLTRPRSPPSSKSRWSGGTSLGWIDPQRCYLPSPSSSPPATEWWG